MAAIWFLALLFAKHAESQESVKKNDFLYLPAGVRHGVANSSDAPVKVIVMGYKLPAGTKVEPTPKLMLAWGKLELQKSGKVKNPWIDPQGYRGVIAAFERDFGDKVKQQLKDGPPPPRAPKKKQ